MGKRPLWDNWQSVELTDATLSDVEGQHPDHTGTGLRTGRLVVADIDITDSDQADAIGDIIESVLGASACHRYGRKGKAILFRNPEPIGKITVSGKNADGKVVRLVEFLGKGQQVAAFGIHPDTNQPYAWPVATPLDVPLADLPEVSGDLIRECAAKVAASLARPRIYGRDQFRSPVRLAVELGVRLARATRSRPRCSRICSDTSIPAATETGGLR